VYQSYGLPIAAGTISGGLKRLAPLFDPLREAFHTKKMAKEMAIFVLAFCWAHVRRDFIKAARKNSQEKERGKLGKPGILSTPIKDLWIYPLKRNCSSILKANG